METAYDAADYRVGMVPKGGETVESVFESRDSGGHQIPSAVTHHGQDVGPWGNKYQFLCCGQKPDMNLRMLLLI